MKKCLFLTFIFLFSGVSYAQQNVIPGDSANNPQMNEEIRRLHSQIGSLPFPIDLTNNVKGVLPQANGGTGSSSFVAIPQGVIVMWSGTISSIPSGWELSDGTCQITCPDLRDRFIVGATQDSSGIAKTNVTGSLTQSGDGQIPSHTHTLGDSVTVANDAITNPGQNLISVSGSSNSTGSYGAGTKTISVYYALAFIIKD